jgi:molecular chaperone GrpE (heat shock protein)
MANFSSQEEIRNLRQKLKDIRSDFTDFEEEKLILYPFVIDHLEKAGLKQF